MSQLPFYLPSPHIIRRLTQGTAVCIACAWLAHAPCPDGAAHGTQHRLELDDFSFVSFPHFYFKDDGEVLLAQLIGTKAKNVSQVDVELVRLG